MKFDKKVMESGVVAAFSMVLAFTAVPANCVSTNSVLDSRTVELIAETTRKNWESEFITKAKKQHELVASAAETKQQKEEVKSAVEENNAPQNVVEENAVEENAVSQNAIEENAAKEKAAPQKAAEKDTVEEKAVEEVSPWADKLLPKVDEYLNVRTEASEESEPAGKLPKGASAQILEAGEEWTKISSGNVEGYVKNEFCVTGSEAETLANEVGTTYATAVTGGVRVRETASSEEDVTILDVLEEGGKIKVDTEAEPVEGWVCVKLDDGTAYVSAEYVSVELELGKAISIEEERAAIEAAEAERRAKEAAQSSSSQSQSAGTQQKAAVAASYDDVTLLGALIQCEAGGECYEGQLAVGAVVMNRVRAGYAGSISDVIYQSGQFPPATNGTMAGVLASGVSGSCIQAAQQAISGVDNVNGATSFRNVGSGIPGIVIGNQVFF